MEDTHYYILSPIACNEITIDEFWRLQGRTDGPPRPAEPTEEDVKKKLIEYGVKDPFVVKVVQDIASVVTFMWVDLHDVDFLPDALGPPRMLRMFAEPEEFYIFRTLLQAKLHSVVHSFHSFDAFCEKLIEEKGVVIDDEIRGTVDECLEELSRKRVDFLMSIGRAGEEEIKKIEEELEKYAKTIQTSVKKIISGSVHQPVSVTIIGSRIADLEKELSNKNSECTTLQNDLSEAKKRISEIIQELDQVKQELIAEYVNEGKSCVDFVIEFSKFVEDEERRAKMYDSMTLSSMHEFLIHNALRDCAGRVLDMNNGLFQLLDKRDFHNLSLLYNLFKLDEKCLECLVEKVKNYIIVTCSAVMDPLKAPKTTTLDGSSRRPNMIKRKQGVDVITTVMTVRNVVEEAIDLSFENNPAFKKALEEGLSRIMNDEDLQMALFLSLYVDDLIVSEFQKKQEGEFDIVIDHVVQLFGFLKGKDAFEKFYIRHMNNRLLSVLKSEYINTEILLFEKLGKRSTDFTEQAKQSVKTIQDGFDEVKDFEKYARENEKPVNGLNVLVLTRVLDGMHLIPNNSHSSIPLPPNIRDSLNAFFEFDSARHGKKGQLRVVLSYGNAEIQQQWSSVYTLVTSTIQMLILNLFNDPPKRGSSETCFTVKEICTRLSLDMKDVKDSLVYLSKLRIIRRKKGGGSESSALSESDVIYINSGFKYKTDQVQCYPTNPDTVLRIDDLEEDVEVSRMYQLRAQIVRVMKARKKLAYNQLFSSVYDIVCRRFHPPVPLFKSVIEWLIDYGYLERDEGDTGVFHYLA